jgi:phospholipid/cholesterol/gamma-HCH transport system substrate-binding protein
MIKQTQNRVKLGVFVVMATFFLILGLYYIGSKKNLFTTTITVSTNFDDVGGLMQGNNVRFNGINIGTITKVYPISDTLIRVDFTIDESKTKFITKNAITSIGTDGLLGNKLINISPGKKSNQSIKEGDILQSMKPLQMTSALRTLITTNENVEIISENLKNVSQKLTTDNTLWQLLNDPAIANNVKNAIVNFKLTGTNSAIITGDLSAIVKDIQSGKGSIGALLMNTNFSDKLNQTVVKIEAISDSAAILTGNFNTIAEKMNDEKGTLITLLSDTTFIHNFSLSLENIKDGTKGFSDNMEALKHSIFLKKYFKKKLKSKK